MLGKLFDDLKKGENLDLYVTLGLAIVLAVLKPILDLFGVNVSQTAIVSATMSVLVAITIVLLVNRKKVESLERQLTRQSQSDIVTALPNSYSSDLAGARKIFQSGIHLSSNLNDHYEQYESILQNRRSSIRFLIVQPDGSALRMAASRFRGTPRLEQERARAQSSLRVIGQLMEKYPGRIELRVIDYLFEYSGLLIESTSGDEVLYLERYTFRRSGGAMKPKFTYTPDSPWFDFIKEEMEELWKAAEPYQIGTRIGQ